MVKTLGVVAAPYLFHQCKKLGSNWKPLSFVRILSDILASHVSPLAPDEACLPLLDQRGSLTLGDDGPLINNTI